jgi:hypothetical protein
MTRTALGDDQDYAKAFAKARQRVSKMFVRVIEIKDQITQYLFEAYAILLTGPNANWPRQLGEAQYSASERLLWVQYQRVVVASARGLI